MQKVEFKVKVGEEEQGYVVKLPDGKLRKKARELKADHFRKEAFKEGTVFTYQIPELLKRKGLWSDEKDEELKRLSKEIEEKLRGLSKGKTPQVPTKDILRSIILNEIKPLRTRQLELFSERSQLDSLSIESEAQQLEIDYLVVESTYTDMDDKVYEDLPDYKSRSDEPYTEIAGQKLVELMGLSDSNWAVSLPENKLLIKYKFMNEKGQYINEDGDLISADGKRIDSDGYYLNENNERIDEWGNAVDEKGEVILIEEFE